MVRFKNPLASNEPQTNSLRYNNFGVLGWSVSKNPLASSEPQTNSLRYNNFAGPRFVDTSYVRSY
jgi:hypothetical protein